eukprot:GHVU01229609.1.p1 GENE.GHVU01229609.1~~GHVU01229609.1.p1  ORF type:complete len:115 (-),score=7.07 GHVU01229609.1:50-394(-)
MNAEIAATRQNSGRPLSDPIAVKLTTRHRPDRREVSYPTSGFNRTPDSATTRLRAYSTNGNRLTDVRGDQRDHGRDPPTNLPTQPSTSLDHANQRVSPLDVRAATKQPTNRSMA